MSYKYLGPNKWYIYIAPGRHQPKYRETFHGTEQEARAYEAAIRKTLGHKVNHKKLTFSALKQDYIEHIQTDNRATHPKSIRNVILILDRLERFFGRMFLDAIPKAMQLTYQKSRRKEIRDARIQYLTDKGLPVKLPKYLGARMVNLELLALYAMCTWAIEEGKITTKIEKVKKLEENKPLPNPIPMPEADALIAALDPVHCAMCCLIYNVGLRPHEVWTLEKPDINWEEKNILIRGKGDRQRIEPFDVISKYLEALPGIHDGEGLIFPSRTGGNRGDMRKAIRAAAKRAGIKRHITVYMLKHTFCTELLRKTGNLRLVQLSAGHQKMETTIKYTKVITDQIRAGQQATFGGK